MVSLDDLGFQNKKFWTGFIISSFPTSLDEDADMELSELMEENELVDIDIDWWSDFTKYYDGVLEETDGYLDDPEMLICKLTDTQTLKIEFHPGDIVYYVNDKQIACTGGEYMIQIPVLLRLYQVLWKKFLINRYVIRSQNVSYMV